MSTCQIREFEDDDMDQIVALWKKAGVTRPWNDAVRDIRFCQESASSTLLVLCDGNCIKGTAMVGEDGHRGWVYYVAVEPAEQSQGLGSQLMEAAEVWLEARGIWKVNLLVRAGNKSAETFYEKTGYADTGTRCFQKTLASDVTDRG